MAWSFILESMRRILSLGGLALQCGDAVVRVLVPGVYILSHDFEEQWVIAYSLPPLQSPNLLGL